MGLQRTDKFSKKHSSRGRPWGVNKIYGAEDGTRQTVYMWRAWLGRLRLHVFFRGDQDPDCHDHPWPFWTFPLRSYVEEYLVPRRRKVYTPGGQPNGMATVDGEVYYERRTRVVRAFRFHHRDTNFKHRVLGAARPLKDGGYLWPGRYFTREIGPVEAIPNGIIPTIVWRGKATGRLWGFIKERNGKWCWQLWTDYVYEGGKNAPCE